jgi:hypothetical protein
MVAAASQTGFNMVRVSSSSVNVETSIHARVSSTISEARLVASDIAIAARYCRASVGRSLAEILLVSAIRRDYLE